MYPMADEQKPQGYMIVLKDSATEDQVNELTGHLESQGGCVTGKTHSKFVKSVSAQINPAKLQSLQSFGSGIIDYIEPDQTVSI